MSEKVLKDLPVNEVNVRWHDGYHEKFSAVEVRFGCALLFLRLTNGENRHIPLCSVRTFSLSRESHFKDYDAIDS